MTQTKIALRRGQKYDTAKLTLIGWTSGDDSGTEGYQVADYFPGGIYLGSDDCGIAPIMARLEATKTAKTLAKHANTRAKKSRSMKAVWEAKRADKLRAKIMEAYRLTERLESECARNYTPELEANCIAATKAYHDLCDVHPECAPHQNES